MDKTLIIISSFVLLAILFLLIFLFKSIKKSSYKASDGSLFDSQSDLDTYQKLIDRTKPLFSYDNKKSDMPPILGFEVDFLNKIKSDGFNDLKTLIKYKKQLKALSELINN